MALGGGTFLTENKILPGYYLNVVSQAAATASMAERGTVTVPLELDWGVDDAIFTVTNEDFQTNSLKIFGYAYDDDKMKGLRDLFKGAKTLHTYKLTSLAEGAAKAQNTFATAKYKGVRGNDIKIKIAKNVDDDTKWDVTTLISVGGAFIEVDSQTVAAASGLVSNDFVDFKTGATLAAQAGLALTGGANGAVTSAAYQRYADLISGYSFNVMGILTTEVAIKNLFISLVNRMRDERGIKYQLVLHRAVDACNPDYLGVISVENNIDTDVDSGYQVSAAVYWVAGKEAGANVNESIQNTVYDGEFTILTDYSQTELEQALSAGKFIFHNNNNKVCVLEDINTFVTVTDVMGEVFKDNQTIRVIDQIAIDDAKIFNDKYNGHVPNDPAGRISLWTDLVKIRQNLNDLRAIENFVDTDVTVAQGDSKKSVRANSALQVVNTMSKLYMTVVVV